MSYHTPVEYSEVSSQKYTLRDLLLILFRRKWFVLGLSLPIVLLGFYGTMTTTASFLASSEVLIEARAIENPSFSQKPVDFNILMNTVAEVAKSIPVARLAAKAAMDSLSRFQAPGSSLSEVTTEAELLDIIMGGTSCGQIGESNILSIGYSHQDADFAIFIVGLLTDSYKNFAVEGRKNSHALEYYSEQIDLVQGEIEELMAQRVEVFSDGGMDAFKINNTSGIQQMRAVEYTYVKARSVREGLEDRFRGVSEAIEVNQDYVPSMISSGRNAGIIGAKSSLDIAVRDLEKLRLTYQEDSVYVQRQLAYVEKVRSMFRIVRDDYIRDLSIELDSAIAEESSLASSLESYRNNLLKFPELEKRLFSLDFRIDTKKDLLESLQMKHGEVRLKSDSDSRVSNIIKLNEPSIGVGVAGGKKIIYLLITAVLALVLGVVAALLIDFQDHRIYDRRQAENMLEIPVLGAISPAQLTNTKP